MRCHAADCVSAASPKKYTAQKSTCFDERPTAHAFVMPCRRRGFGTDALSKVLREPINARAGVRRSHLTRGTDWQEFSMQLTASHSSAYQNDQKQVLGEALSSQSFQCRARWTAPEAIRPLRPKVWISFASWQPQSRIMARSLTFCWTAVSRVQADAIPIIRFDAAR